MAITKKALQIQEQKTALVLLLLSEKEAIVSACGRVPDSVLSGPWQLAVAWRTKAEE